jgi:hypothetical protein
MKTNFFYASLVCFLIMIIIGCSTPKPVLHLAGQGIAMTEQTESELNHFVERSNYIYGQRLEAIKRIATSNIQAYADMDFENYTVELADMRAQAEMMSLIRDLSDHRLHTRETAMKQQADLEKSLNAGDPTKVQKEKFSDLMKGFAVLSEELTPREWLDFTVNYGKQVNGSVKKLKEEADGAKNKADQDSQKLQ